MNTNGNDADVENYIALDASANDDNTGCDNTIE